MRDKPIKIVRVTGGGYNVFVNGTPVVRDGKGVTIDRVKAGLKPGKGRPPKETEPVLIEKARDAAGVAHQIGRYLLDLGDFVFSYTELVGIEGSHEAWWNKANKA